MVKGFGLSDIVGIQKNNSSSKEKIQSTSGSLDNIVKIPVENCYEGSFQPRSFITEKAITAMCNSIDNEGQHQPVIVYLKGKAHQNLAKNNYFIVSGHTRLEAFRRLGKRSINAIVYTNINKALVASVTTNEVSTGLHVVDKGTAMQSLLDSGAFGTQQELAEYFGCSQGLISRYLGWNILPKEVKAKIVEFNIISKTLLNTLKKKFKSFEKGRSEYSSIEELVFEVVSDIEEFNDLKTVKKVKSSKTENSEITNFLYMKNNDDFIVRERAIKKLDFDQKKKLLKELEKMKALIEINL